MTGRTHAGIDEILSLIRGTRATPPRLAEADPARRRTYNASLQQFEELVMAADALGPASQPLAMFYALEQAGQAIIAAHLHRQARPAHGLRATEYDGPIHEVLIEPKGDGAFQAVAEALGLQGITTNVRLGALWASLPESSGNLFVGTNYPMSLALFPDDRPGPSAVLTVTDVASAWLFSLPEEVASAPLDKRQEMVAAYLTKYPTAAGWESPIDRGVPSTHDPAAGFGIRLQWRLPESTGSAGKRFEFLLTNISPRYDRYWWGYLRPAVDGTSVLHPLLTWWSILYALSMFARYRPAVWVERLDVTSSPDAVRLERLLSESLKSVPALVYEALTGHQQLRFDR